MIDMFCHWWYVTDNLFGDIGSLVAHGETLIDERVGESGKSYACTADDTAYAMFKLKDGLVVKYNSSWCTRVRRDDLLTLQIDGTRGSAVAGLRKCWIQPYAATPKPVWNPDIDSPIKFFDTWSEVPDQIEFDNAFKAQWELFLRHVVLDEPFRWTLREGAKNILLAEKGIESWKKKCWMDLPTDF